MHEILKKKVLKEMLKCDICKKLVALSVAHKKEYKAYKEQYKDHLNIHFSDIMRNLFKGNISITKVIHLQCPRCGGKLTHIEEHIKKANFYDFAQSMAGKSYIFTGEKCDHCEERVSGTYTPTC